jgi:hypothetical protein
MKNLRTGIKTIDEGRIAKLIFYLQTAQSMIGEG